MRNAVVVGPSNNLGTPTPAGRRPAPRRRTGLVIAAALVASFILGKALWTDVADDFQRRPLQAIEDASSNAGRSISVIAPAVADSWFGASENAPSEAELREILGTGNVYLEPIFYAFNRRGSLPVREERCYFVAVQTGVEFDAARVKNLIRVCYIGAGQSPNSVSSSAATG